MWAKTFLAFFSFLFSSLLFVSCVSQSKQPMQQPLVHAVVEEPPNPPTLKNVESPLNLILEKSPRDPFISLEPSATPESKVASVSEGFSVSGILSNQISSAIVNRLHNSYIVHRGDRIDGYHVAQITSKSVTLEKGNHKLVLYLLRH